MGKLAAMTLTLLLLRRPNRAFGQQAKQAGFFGSGQCNTCHTLGAAGLLALTLAACSGEQGSAASEGPAVECALAGAARDRQTSAVVPRMRGVSIAPSFVRMGRCLRRLARRKLVGGRLTVSRRVAALTPSD